MFHIYNIHFQGIYFLPLQKKFHHPSHHRLNREYLNSHKNKQICGEDEWKYCLYWQGEEYLGIGSAAHSMVLLEENKRKRYNHKTSIEEYIKNPYNIDNQEIISASDALLEDIIFGLRMKKGINLYNLEKKFGKINKSLLNKIETNINYGLLEKDGIWLKTTQKGSLVLESLSCSLLP